MYLSQLEECKPQTCDCKATDARVESIRSFRVCECVFEGCFTVSPDSQSSSGLGDGGPGLSLARRQTQGSGASWERTWWERRPPSICLSLCPSAEEPLDPSMVCVSAAGANRQRPAHTLITLAVLLMHRTQVIRTNIRCDWVVWKLPSIWISQQQTNKHMHISQSYRNEPDLWTQKKNHGFKFQVLFVTYTTIQRLYNQSYTMA